MFFFQLLHLYQVQCPWTGSTAAGARFLSSATSSQSDEHPAELLRTGPAPFEGGRGKDLPADLEELAAQKRLRDAQGQEAASFPADGHPEPPAAHQGVPQSGQGAASFARARQQSQISVRKKIRNTEKQSYRIWWSF